MTSVIACGDGTMSNGKYRGIASGAKLVLVKVSTPIGHIKEADILRGLRWVIDTYQRFNVRVVNISVGGDYVYNKADHLLHKAIRKLTKAGTHQALLRSVRRKMTRCSTSCSVGRTSRRIPMS